MTEIITISEQTEVEGHFQYLSDQELHYRFNNVNYQGTIEDSGQPKLFNVKINGNVYQIKIESALDELIDEMGLNVIEKNGVGDIYSPMPGLVLEILVQEGQEVESGQALVILEAMKMENIIKSSGKGIIKEIKIENGQKIDKAQLLITITSEE